MRALLVISMYFVSVTSQANPGWRDRSEKADYIHRSIKKMTDVIVYDIYSPPVASRTYAYICVAAYEAAYHLDAGYQSFAGQLHGLNQLPRPDAGSEYSYTLAAVYAVLTVGKALVISEDAVETFKKQVLQEFKDTGMPANVYDHSVEYGQQLATSILSWASADNYRQTRSLAKYAVSEDPAAWKPTPPAYIKAIEPNWSKIRTFVIDSAQQFMPFPPPLFSVDRKSRVLRVAHSVD
jgi:hypothetical protein